MTEWDEPRSGEHRALDATSCQEHCVLTDWSPCGHETFRPLIYLWWRGMLAWTPYRPVCTRPIRRSRLIGMNRGTLAIIASSFTSS